jgi:ribosomal protein S30
LNHQGFYVWGGGAGKVHGSLARAGKVRGQTPKVAKQDKKKKPTGRAHKRMQYNRRFVTAGTSQDTSTFSSPVFFVFQAYTI